MDKTQVVPRTTIQINVFGLSRRRLLNLCTVKCSLASSRERVATCPESAVNLWVVRTSGRKRESVGRDHFIARRVRHRLGPLRGLANMIPYTVCSSSSPTQDMVALGSSRSDELHFFRQATLATTRKTATSTRLRPRDGVTPAWEEQLMDIEAARGYTKLRDSPQEWLEHKLKRRAAQIAGVLFALLRRQLRKT